MRRLLFGSAILLALSAVAVVGFRPAPVGAAGGQPPLGMNLAGVADWSSEIIFVDAMKASRPWISQAVGKKFGEGGPLAVDERGWVTALRDGQFAETLMFVELADHFPGGDYVCLYDGTGELEFLQAARATKSAPGRVTVNVAPGKGMVSIQIKKTDPKDPVRNIRLVMPDHEKTYADSPFYPPFLKRYQGFSVLRFMDWQRTNNSKQVKWADRPLPSDTTQAADKGVCLELIVELANTLDADPWLCLPHLADDDYVRQFATLVKAKLKASRKIYVEYSNETWNSQFEQARYCLKAGKELGLSKNDYEAQLRYSAHRSGEIFRIFEDVFGGKNRLVRVLSAQGANPWTGTTVMDWKNAYKGADAMAIAPYFGNAFGDPKTADTVAAMDVEALLDGCKKSLAENKDRNAEYAKAAKKRGLQLVTYEFGQHLTGYGGAENNDKLTALFQAANRNPKMRDLYLEDLNNWKEIGGGLNCIFSSVGRYSKWGSWGMMEYGDQDESTAPKMQAVREFMRQGR